MTTDTDTDTDPRIERLDELIDSLRDAEYRNGMHRTASKAAIASVCAEALKSYLTTLLAKVPSAPVDPHPDTTQLISIADILPTLSGADPTMLANVGHYLRGLSDRVKVLPVARTGPLRVAAEAVSAPVEAVPDSRQNCRNLTIGEDGECVHCYAIAGQQCQYESSTTPPQAEPSHADVDHLNGMVREAVRGLEERDAEIARLTEELADEKAVVDVLRSELQDRLQKQRAAEAEPQEATQWVDVNERQPEKFQEVLIAFAGQCNIAATGQYTASPHDHGGWCYPAENHGANDAGEGWPTVTHWQRLPVVPEATKP